MISNLQIPNWLQNRLHEIHSRVLESVNYIFLTNLFKSIWWFIILIELFTKNYFVIFFRADHDYIELRVQVKEEVEDDDKSESGDLKIVEQVRFK